MEIFFQSARKALVVLSNNNRSPITAAGDSMALTSGAIGVVLDVLALLDEFVLSGGAGEAALSTDASLGGEARGAANGLSGGKHGDGNC